MTDNTDNIKSRIREDFVSRETSDGIFQPQEVSTGSGSFYSGMDESWIKIHRKLLDHWVWDSKHEYLKIWITLLLKANWKPNKIPQGTGFLTIDRGELIIGLHQFADECKIGVGYVRKFLKLAEKDGMILVKSNKNGTHIKVINYKDLQSRQNQSEQDANKMRTRSEQDANNSIRREEGKKERKKELKEEREGRAKARPHALSDVIEYMATISLPESEARKFMDYYESNGWKVGKSPMKDWKAACRNWKLRYNEHKGPVNALQARTKPQGIPKAVSELYARPSVPTEVITEYLDKIKNK